MTNTIQHKYTLKHHYSVLLGGYGTIWWLLKSLCTETLCLILYKFHEQETKTYTNVFMLLL